MGCGCNNGCGCGSSWIVILIIICCSAAVSVTAAAVMTVAAAADYPVGARYARHALPYIIRSKNRGVPIAPMVKDRRFLHAFLPKTMKVKKYLC